MLLIASVDMPTGVVLGSATTSFEGDLRNKHFIDSGLQRHSS